MKTRSFFFGFFSLLITAGAVAQGIEGDDMYFNSNDRKKLNAQIAEESRYVADNNVRNNQSNTYDAADDVNATDSYSARNVNPEYTSRTHSQTAQVDNEDYYVSNYQYSNKYNTANQYNNFNSNYNNWYNSPSWYNSSWYGSSMYSMNSPYYNGYGGMYSPYNYYSPYYGSFYNPYYGGSGMYSSFGYGWGMGSGFSMGIGYGMGIGSMGMMGMGYGYPYYGGGFYGNPYYGGYYPTTVIVERGNAAYRTNGRGSNVVTRSNNGAVNPRSVNNNYYSPNRSTGNIGGRTSTAAVTNNAATHQRANSNQADYYNRGWRNNTSSGTNNGNSGNTWRNSGNTNNGGFSRPSSNWGNNQNNSFSNPSRSNYGGNGGFSGGHSGGFGGGGGGGFSGGGGGGHRGR